jgi:hypothetical protein
MPLLVVLDLIRLEDLDFEVLQDGEDVVDFLLVLDGLGQGLVDVVEGQVALLLGEADQVPDLVVDAARRDGVGDFGSRPRRCVRGFWPMAASTASDWAESAEADLACAT